MYVESIRNTSTKEDIESSIAFIEGTFTLRNTAEEDIKSSLLAFWRIHSHYKKQNIFCVVIYNMWCNGEIDCRSSIQTSKTGLSFASTLFRSRRKVLLRQSVDRPPAVRNAFERFLVGP
jgi:hypothetical protein